MNAEEKQNIISICNEYSDIFYLEGDCLTATDAVTNKINTSLITKAINKTLSYSVGVSGRNRKTNNKNETGQYYS